MLYNDSDNNDQHFENIDNYYQNHSNRFGSQEFLYTDSDNKTIIEFDDEYSEDPNLYPNKNNASENKNRNLNQGEKSNEEQNEEDQNEEEEEQSSEVTDPNVKQLMNMNMDDKEAVLNLLMKDNLLSKQEANSEEIIKEKNKNKYNYVESRVLNNKKENSYGREGFQINPEEGDPQFVKDMNTAAFLLKDKIEEENKEVAKLLLDDINLNCSNKIITSKQIREKIKKTLHKKRKNLEKIEAKISEEQKITNTFSPIINHRIGETKRSFNKFLKDQDDYSKKVVEKKNALLKTAQKENTSRGKPQLNKTSEEIAKRLKLNEEPAYLRLYKNKDNKLKSKAIEEEKLIQQQEKEEYLKKKLIYNKKNPYSHIESKIDMGKKKHTSVHKKDYNTEFNSINKIRVPESRKAKSLDKQFKTFDYYIRNKKLLDFKDILSNKIVYNNFGKKFDDIVQNNSDKNELDEISFQKSLKELGMITYFSNNNENKEMKNSESTPDILLENSLSQNEKKLIGDIFNLLKNDENKIQINDLKKFLNCIIGNQNYELYRNYKIKHANELKNLFPSNKFKKEEIPELMIKNQNKELISEINISNPKNNKYISYSNDNQIIIPLEKGKLIKKDFHILGLNYRNNKKKSKDNLQLIKKFPFKPSINENSEKLSLKMREKVILAKKEMEKNKNGSVTHLHTNPNMEYIDRILLLDKKRIAENKKIKEELEKKEIKECTFKPKINKNFLFTKEEYKDLNKIRNSHSNSNILKSKNTSNNSNKSEKEKEKFSISTRFEKIYQKGKEKLRDKKNRTKEEIEAESQKEECTFKPNTKQMNYKDIPVTHFTNDIYNEKEYQDLYERLKKGRMERMVKNSANDRYDLDPELKQFIKDNKENEKQQYYEEGYEEYEDMDINNINQNLDQELLNTEKKEGIPLLIIDVNIRQGVKKKIYVYEGDTPAMLAEKFAKENQLEPETQNKLQNLIHTHMLKLLTRIDEENQSVSEKSQPAHNNNNMKLGE